jgi:enterochelin esterase-like enzyme
VAVVLLLLAAADVATLGSVQPPQTPTPEAPRTPALVAAPAPATSTTPFIVAADGIKDARPPRPTPVGAPVATPAATDLTSDTRQRIGAVLRQVKGRVLERSFRSESLGRDMPYLIYLPPGFAQSRERYPVLYILHGRGGARTDWVTAGLLEAVDRGIQSGQCTRMLVVFPEGFDGYWTNHTAATGDWGDYMVRDLVAQVDANYPTAPRAAARAIGGQSMGGWGALHLSFTHPEVFGVVGAHSPALRPDDGTLAFLGTGAEFARKDPISLARQLPSTVPLKIWMDTGRDDPWMSRATLLHTILTERGVAHTWNVFAGNHSWTYWRAHVGEYVQFYSKALAHTAAAP